jgi:hypothetical protein
MPTRTHICGTPIRRRTTLTLSGHVPLFAIRLTSQPFGRNITVQLLRLASDLHISKPLGIAPNDLYLARYPYGHSHSILTEWAEKVLPATVHEKGRSETRLIITQTGSIRFDLVCHCCPWDIAA